jgi:hypothetical protein
MTAHVVDLQREYDQTRAELIERRSALQELRAATAARYRAHEQLTAFFREREIARAAAVERNPAWPLH